MNVLETKMLTFMRDDGKMTVTNLLPRLNMNKRSYDKVQKKMDWLCENGLVEDAYPNEYYEEKWYKISDGGLAFLNRDFKRPDELCLDILEMLKNTTAKDGMLGISDIGEHLMKDYNECKERIDWMCKKGLIERFGKETFETRAYGIDEEGLFKVTFFGREMLKEWRR